LGFCFEEFQEFPHDAMGRREYFEMHEGDEAWIIKNFIPVLLGKVERLSGSIAVCEVKWDPKHVYDAITAQYRYFRTGYENVQFIKALWMMHDGQLARPSVVLGREVWKDVRQSRPGS
jgi:hypothetical protein